jgi:hypothetical protein
MLSNFSKIGPYLCHLFHSARSATMAFSDCSNAWRRLVAKVGTSNTGRIISLKRLQCVVENNNNCDVFRTQNITLSRIWCSFKCNILQRPYELFDIVLLLFVFVSYVSCLLFLVICVCVLCSFCCGPCGCWLSVSINKDWLIIIIVIVT